MKRIVTFLAFAAVLATACTHDVNYDFPEIQWSGNPKFEVQEYMPGADGSIIINAPYKIQSIKLTLNLGQFNNLANPYIAISSYKGSSSKPPVMDIIDDPSVAKFLTGLGISSGPLVRGGFTTSINCMAILETLLVGQLIENNTTFTLYVEVIDQQGYRAEVPVRFHYTSAPVVTWPGNPEFGTIDLNADKVPVKVNVSAPGKIASLTVTLEYGGAPELATYIQNRTTGSSLIIDLLNDSMVAETFKNYFPTGKVLDGKTDATLDFGFMYDCKYDLSPSTNVFSIQVTDKAGKSSMTQVKFRR